MKAKLFTGLAVCMLGACAVANATDDDDDTPRKVFVCKYVGTPGADERLQTGQNPISVDYHSLEGEPAIGQFFEDAQGRSVVIAFDVGQPEPDVSDCPQPTPSTTTTVKATTTTAKATTTTAKATTTTQPHQTTTTGAGPTTTVVINTVVITGPSTTTTTGVPTSTSTTTSTSLPTGTSTTTTTSTTSTTQPPGIGPPPPPTPFVPFQPQPTTTTLPPPTTAPPPPPTPFAFGAAATVCVAEVPTIRINFQNTFPELAGRTGTLTMEDVNGNVVSTQPLTYRPNTSVDLLYPGTSVNPDGSIDDVPGWILTDDGLWVRDPSDAFLRDGIRLTYELNPTATAFITYPPESSTCANPDGPFAPPAPRLPPTR